MEIARERHKALGWLSTPQHRAIFFSESVQSIELFGRGPNYDPGSYDVCTPRIKSAKNPLECALESGANRKKNRAGSRTWTERTLCESS